MWLILVKFLAFFYPHHDVKETKIFLLLFFLLTKLPFFFSLKIRCYWNWNYFFFHLFNVSKILVDQLSHGHDGFDKGRNYTCFFVHYHYFPKKSLKICMKWIRTSHLIILIFFCLLEPFRCRILIIIPNYFGKSEFIHLL